MCTQKGIERCAPIVYGIFSELYFTKQNPYFMKRSCIHVNYLFWIYISRTKSNPIGDQIEMPRTQRIDR